MFIIVSSVGIETAEGYSSAVKAAQAYADSSGERARVYRMPHTVEFIACPAKKAESPPIVATKKAKRK